MKTVRFVQIFLSVCFLFITSTALFATPKEEAQQGVFLLDYVARDYQNAVGQEGGTVISSAEYEEMEEFVSLIESYLKNSRALLVEEVRSDLQKLKVLIHNKGRVEDVKRVALKLRGQLIELFGVSTRSENIPDLNLGREIYHSSCAPCHGLDGRAHTEIAQRLDPPPRVFTDSKFFDNVSPFQAFNTVTFGLVGTSMPSFSLLSDEERWAVASYLFTFRSDLPKPQENLPPLISWKVAMQRNDFELLSDFKAKGLSESDALQQLSQVRHVIYQQEQDQHVASEGIKKSKVLLVQSRRAYLEGDRKKATDLAVSAYLDGFETSETLLIAIGRQPLRATVEQHFLMYRKALRSGSKTVDIAFRSLMADLTECEEALESNRGLSATGTLIGAFFIIFREGIEAILLLAIIFTVLTSLEMKSVIRWFHVSWFIALIVGVFTWLLAEKMLSGKVREGLEGWVGLLSAVVLIYVSFWLLSKKDAEKWKSYLLGKLQRSSRVGVFSIFSVTFLAVYREVFETVLFLQTLKLQSDGQSLWIILGIVGALFALGAVALAIFYTGRQLPFNAFFSVSGHFLYGLALVFVGQAIHSLGEANLVSQSPAPFVTIPPLGIFPFWEGLICQGVLLVGYILAFFWKKKADFLKLTA